MAVYRLPFELCSALITLPRVSVGIAYRIMETAVQNFRVSQNRLLKPEKPILFPISMNGVLETNRNSRYNAKLDDQKLFLRNISLAKVCLDGADSALKHLDDILTETMRTFNQLEDKSPNQGLQKPTAKKLEKLFFEIFQVINSQVQGKYIFSGNHITIPPFRKEKAGVVYQAGSEEVEVRVEPGTRMKINLAGSNLLTKPLKPLGENSDLVPGIDRHTRLSDLNLGKGIDLGSIRLNRPAMSEEMDPRHATTVGDLMDFIETSEIAILGADIKASPRSLRSTDTRFDDSDSWQRGARSEADDATAGTLGMVNALLVRSHQKSQSLEGLDLNPILTEKTPISLLKRGKGVTLGSIRYVLGEVQRIVDLSKATTVGEIIDAMNDSMPGVIASLNDSKRGISVESTVTGKSLVVCDGDDKKSASVLGISGSPDILGTLLFLIDALNNGESEAIDDSLDILNLGLTEISDHRAEVNAKLKILENIQTRPMCLPPNTPQLLSRLSPEEALRATSDLTNQKSVFQSALKRGVEMTQPALLDFIR